MSFSKMSEIMEASQSKNLPLWKVIMDDDVQERKVTEAESFSRMEKMLDAMIEADKKYNPDLRSQSGLSGGDGAKLETFRKNENRLIGTFLAMVMEKAVKMAESNACMGRIVAAPTAGSCGVIPAVLLTYLEEKNADKARLVEALFIAAGIGQVIAETASISGAEGGCQAEIGSASSMAAGALTYLENGTNEQIANAAALAMKNMLGLTCDPVAGLVEVPCIKRNVSGAVNAIISSQMAMAGIKSAIPVDEVFETMGRIGKLIPACLRETSLEGLAAAPSALRASVKNS